MVLSTVYRAIPLLIVMGITVMAVSLAGCQDSAIKASKAGPPPTGAKLPATVAERQHEIEQTQGMPEAQKQYLLQQMAQQRKSTPR